MATVGEVIHGFNERYRKNFGYIDLPSFVEVKVGRFIDNNTLNLLVREVEEKLNCKYFGVEALNYTIEVNFAKKKNEESTI